MPWMRIFRVLKSKPMQKILSFRIWKFSNKLIWCNTAKRLPSLKNSLLSCLLTRRLPLTTRERNSKLQLRKTTLPIFWCTTKVPKTSRRRYLYWYQITRHLLYRVLTKYGLSEKEASTLIQQLLEMKKIRMSRLRAENKRLLKVGAKKRRA